MRAPFFLLVLALALVFTGCSGDSGGGSSSDDPQEERTGVIRSTELPPASETVAKSGPLHFVDRTRDAGITFKVETGSKEKLWIVESIGQGVMLFDYDNDGDLDLYFANGGEIRKKPTGRIYWNSLWRNDGNWRFTDVTEGSGLECPEWSCSDYTVDYDADGFRDVYVTQLGKNRLFRNDGGTGRFEDVTDTVGGGCEEWSSSAAFFDADADGDLDLYVCNYLSFDIDDPPNKGLPCEWKDLKVCCGPRGLPESVDTFYEFVDGRFVDATEKFGFHFPDRQGRPRGAYALGVVTGDYDDDGDPDVYVAVDSRPNLCYENLGGGRFREVAADWQTAVNIEAVEQAGMGVAAGDLNEDHRSDLWVTNFSHDTNTLYVNAGTKDNMYFTDDTSLVGLGGEASFSFLSWGTGIHDFNCDGLLDIHVASGHVYPQAEGVVNLGTSYAQLNQLFMGRSRKPLAFKNAADDAGPAFALRQVSRGTAYGDFDRDGRIDIVVVNLDDWPNLIRNESDIVGSWIGVVLRSGDARNPDAIGAVVRFTFEDGEVIRREMYGGGGYLGTSETGIHLGYQGNGKRLKSIEVQWPDGEKESFGAPADGAWHFLDRGTGAAKARPAPPVAGS